MAARLILLALLLAQLGDTTTFVLGESLHGIHLESNAIAVAAYGWAGLAGVLLLKGGALLLMLGVTVLAGYRYPRLLVWGGAAGTSMGLLGCAANVASLLILAH